jgi:hypothetical protein
VLTAISNTSNGGNDTKQSSVSNEGNNVMQNIGDANTVISNVNNMVDLSLEGHKLLDKPAQFVGVEKAKKFMKTVNKISNVTSRTIPVGGVAISATLDIIDKGEVSTATKADAAITTITLFLSFTPAAPIGSGIALGWGILRLTVLPNETLNGKK